MLERDRHGAPAPGGDELGFGKILDAVVAAFYVSIFTERSLLTATTRLAPSALACAR